MLTRIILFAVSACLLLLVPIFADGPKDRHGESEANVERRFRDGDLKRANDVEREDGREDRVRLQERIKYTRPDVDRRRISEDEERRLVEQRLQDVQEEEARESNVLERAFDERTERLHEAAKLLEASGMEDLAREVHRRIANLQIERESRRDPRQSVPPAMRELVEEVRHLRHEVQQMREQLHRQGR